MRRFDMADSLDYICRLERGSMSDINDADKLKMITLLRAEFERIVSLEFEVANLQAKLDQVE